MSALKLFGKFEDEADEARRWVMIPEASIWWVEYADPVRIKLHNRHTFIVNDNPCVDGISDSDREAALANNMALSCWCD